MKKTIILTAALLFSLAATARPRRAATSATGFVDSRGVETNLRRRGAISA